MIGAVAVSLVGILTFLFLFWKKLKDDYVASFIFSTAFLIIFGIVIGSVVSAKFFPLWWFWLSLLGASLGFTLGIVKFKIRFYEAFEAAVVSLLLWLALFFLGDAVQNSSPFSLAISLFTWALIVLSYFLARTYKNFTWYRSGRLGFTGLAIAGLFFLIRATIALYLPFMLSFVGIGEVFISGILAFITFLILFNLSRV
jgi:hypothetical protein